MSADCIDRLVKFLVDDILGMTDEEILAEVTADGEDPKRAVRSASCSIN